MITLLTILALVACVKVGFGLLKVFGKVILFIVGFAGIITAIVAIFAVGTFALSKIVFPVIAVIASIYVFKTVYRKVMES